ncbi:MAG: 50S ribosomal protein L9 [Patescibacteria group bacterium]|nr:50S ribosomal protein L9 [Patescibacteria group bacterium]
MNNLGARGAIIEVVSGYARNFLLPQGLAMEYSEAGEKKLRQQAEKTAKLAKKAAAASGKTAQKLQDASFELAVKASSSGSLYSAIHFKEVAELIQKRMSLAVSASELSSKLPLKHLGKFQLSFRRGSDHADFHLTLTGSIS